MGKARTSKRVPAALAKNDARMAEAKLARIRKAAQADIALIRRRKARIVEDFYDIGEALVRLRKPGVLAALGIATFEDLCRDELGMSETTALHLVAIVTGASREEALRFGQEKTAVLVEIASVVGESVQAVASGKLALPSGKRLDVAKASVRELRRAAKELRAKRHLSHGRGRTVTEDERHVAAAIQTSLRQRGVHEAAVMALATRPGHPAKLRIEIPIDAVAVLARALGRSVASRRRVHGRP